jgi:hypothetical protein
VVGVNRQARRESGLGELALVLLLLVLLLVRSRMRCWHRMK